MAHDEYISRRILPLQMFKKHHHTILNNMSRFLFGPLRYYIRQEIGLEFRPFVANISGIRAIIAHIVLPLALQQIVVEKERACRCLD
jgi:hypothetical protein